MNVLHLTLTRNWFEMIRAGIKKEEYREGKEYWRNRLMKGYKIKLDDGTVTREYIGWKDYDRIRFTNGYGKKVPMIEVEFVSVRVDYPKKEWSNGGSELCYVIELGKIIDVRNVEV